MTLTYTHIKTTALFCFICALLLFQLFGCTSNSELLTDAIDPQTTFNQPVEVHHGELIPSKGHYHAHILFVRFDGDDTPWDLWQSYPDAENPSVQEDWMRQFISPELFTETSDYANLTHFFRVASGNQFLLTGETYYTSVPDSFLNRPYGHANRFVIQKLFGDGNPESSQTAIIQKDLTPFDQWKSTNRKTHISEPDSVLDYVIMIYRNPPGRAHPFGGNWQGIAGLGFQEIKIDDGFSVKGSGVNVSGVTQLFQRNMEFTFNLLVHEIAHHLLGGPHPYLGGSSLHPSYWGLFYSYMANLTINAYEREHLGWFSSQPIQKGSSRIDLNDFMTTGESAFFTLENGDKLYFENRQKRYQSTGVTPTYDMATVRSDDIGLMIQRVRAPYSSREQNLIPVPSDGNYNWEISEFSEACGGANLQPVFVKKSPNPFGYSYRDIFVLKEETVRDAGKDRFTLFLYGDDDPENCTAHMRGNLFDTAFSTREGGKRFFTTWSNPPSSDKNGQPFGINFYIEKEHADGMRILFSDDPFFAGEMDTLLISQDMFFEGEIIIPKTVILVLNEGSFLYLAEDSVIIIQNEFIFGGMETLKAGTYTFSDLTQRFPEFLKPWIQSSQTLMQPE